MWSFCRWQNTRLTAAGATRGAGILPPTQRIGGFAGFAALVDALHAAGIAVLMDFVPVHFAPDADRLACFDGAPLFESGPSDWGSLNFDLASPPVRSFLLSSAAFWLQVCRCDGLRVDAIGNALYHCPNGWQAAEFFKTLTAGLHARFPRLHAGGRGQRRFHERHLRYRQRRAGL